MPVRVLLVDDDHLVSATVGRLMMMHGLLVRVCTTAVAALEELAQNEIDVLVLDLAMPDRSGLELLGELRSRRWDRPVVVLTGLAIKEAPELSARYGVFRWLRKPASPEALIGAVREAANGDSRG